MEFVFSTDGFLIDRIVSPYVPLFQSILYGTLGTGFYMIEHRTDSERTALLLREAELLLLKHQFSHHFLFNTLNSIYSMALKKSAGTAEAILKLSGLMRYTLGTDSGNLIPLENEVNFIRDYIDLQKMRMANPEIVSFESVGNFSGKQILPAIMTCFIENAFKHSDTVCEDAEIHVRIEEKDGLLNFETRNKIAKNNDIEISTGIGISNTRKRLEALYSGKYSLTIRSESNEFVVQLTISIK